MNAGMDYCETSKCYKQMVLETNVRDSNVALKAIRKQNEHEAGDFSGHPVAPEHEQASHPPSHLRPLGMLTVCVCGGGGKIISPFLLETEDISYRKTTKGAQLLSMSAF